MNEPEAIEFFVGAAIRSARALPLPEARTFLRGLLALTHEDELPEIRKAYIALCSGDAQLELILATPAAVQVAADPDEAALAELQQRWPRLSAAYNSHLLDCCEADTEPVPFAEWVRDQQQPERLAPMRPVPHAAHTATLTGRALHAAAPAVADADFRAEPHSETPKPEHPMTNRTNLIHRLAELRAGVLYRIRLHFRRWSRLGLHRGESKQTRPFIQYHAALAAIDSCADAAELLPEVRRSTRRLYWRHLQPVRPEELTLGSVARIEAAHNHLHAAHAG